MPSQHAMVRSIAIRRALSPKRAILILVVVGIGTLFTSWLASIRNGFDRDIQALQAMGVPTTQNEAQPQNNMLQPNGAYPCYRAASMILQPGDQADLFLALRKADTYGVAMNSPNLELKIRGKSRKYYDGRMENVLIPFPAAPSSVAARAKGLQPTLDVLRLNVWSHVNFAEDNYFNGTIDIGRGKPIAQVIHSETQMDQVLDLLSVAGAVEIQTGDVQHGSRDLELLARLCSAMSWDYLDRERPGENRALKEKLSNDCLIRLWLLARDMPSDKKGLDAVVRAARWMPAPFSPYKQVSFDMPLILEGYAYARQNPETFERMARYPRIASSPWFSRTKLMMGLAVRQAVGQWRSAFEEMKTDPENYAHLKDVLLRAQLREDKRYPEGSFLDSPFKLEADDALTAAHGLAAYRLMRGAIELMDYFAEHGSFPSSLPSTWKENEIDPFTGKSLLYHLTPGRGFVLYSVGENLRDDGGTVSGPRLVTDGNDISISF